MKNVRRTGWMVVGLAAILAFGSEATSQEQEIGRADVGKSLFEKYRCGVCHSISYQGGGSVKGVKRGPDLTQVGIRRPTEWLTDFVFDPSDPFPDSSMPRTNWQSEREVMDMVAFLLSLKREVPKDKILGSKASEVEKGGALVRAYDCRACHTMGDGGLDWVPPLTHVGRKIRPEWERRWLQDPQKIKPGTFMPTFPFSPEEVQAVAAYLHSLK